MMKRHVLPAICSLVLLAACGAKQESSSPPPESGGGGGGNGPSKTQSALAGVWKLQIKSCGATKMVPADETYSISEAGDFVSRIVRVEDSAERRCTRVDGFFFRLDGISDIPSVHAAPGFAWTGQLSLAAVRTACWKKTAGGLEKINDETKNATGNPLPATFKLQANVLRFESEQSQLCGGLKTEMILIK